MSKKLEAKNSLIEVPIRLKPDAVAAENAASAPRTRTAVGTMAQFVATQSPIHREAEELREQIKAFDGARIVRALLPSSILPSPWANRHEDSFVQDDFVELKREIMEAGGNIQPIKVRPLNGSTLDSGVGATYEIVYGHRRHRACLELNLPVNALIEAVDDQTLFEQMERENRGRKNLSAWEQGCMYRSALDNGLYPSQRKLSESLGVDISLISKSIALAKLPAGIVDAFASPLDIQFRWAQPLSELLQKDPEGALARARNLANTKTQKALTATEVFRHLTAAGAADHGKKRERVLLCAGKDAGRFLVDPKGAVTVSVKPSTLSDTQSEQLYSVINNFMQSL
jgi:ParB family chromosome partitioning protein